MRCNASGIRGHWIPCVTKRDSHCCTGKNERATAGCSTSGQAFQLHYRRGRATSGHQAEGRGREKKRERGRGGGKVEKKRGGGREKKAAYIHLGNHGDFVSTPCALNVAVFPRVPNRKLNEPCAILVLGRPSCETSWNKSAGEVDRIACVNGVKGVM